MAKIADDDVDDDDNENTDECAVDGGYQKMSLDADDVVRFPNLLRKGT